MYFVQDKKIGREETRLSGRGSRLTREKIPGFFPHSTTFVLYTEKCIKVCSKR